MTSWSSRDGLAKGVHQMEGFGGREWDAFICHASEDKQSFVEPLVEELQKYGLRIWFDKFTLHIGSSLRESIDEGLSRSRFGIVALSHAFFSKNWPKKELNALFSRQVNGQNVILPVWHELTAEDIFQYSPLLSDCVASKTSEGLPAIARAIVKVVRPSALRFETSTADAKNAVTRMRDQIRKTHPNLDCRVIIGPQESDSLKMAVEQAALDTVLSGTYDGTRIEVFAADKEAYNQNPLTFRFEMTKEALDKVQDLQKKGKPVEFGPRELIDVSSDVLRLLMPFTDTANRRLIMSPSREIMQRRFRFKLTFALGEERQEFPYVEFETVQPGQEEFVIRSVAPPMPLTLTLSFNLVGGPCKFNSEYSYVGHEMRKIYKAQKALKFVLGGGSLEILDLETDRLLFVIGGAESQVPSDADRHLDNFISALHEIALALNETITWAPNQAQDDSIRIQLLLEAIRTGQVSIPADSITITLKPSPGVDIEKALQQRQTLRIDRAEAPEIATVFGKVLDLGPCVLIIEPVDIQVTSVVDDPSSRLVRISIAQPVIYEFERFCNNSAVRSSRSGA